MTKPEHNIQGGSKAYRYLLSSWSLVDRMLRSGMSKQQKYKAKRYQQLAMMSSSCTGSSMAQYTYSDVLLSNKPSTRTRDF